MKVGVIIPALNEEKSLPLVLQALPPVMQVVVVDNGSTDRTALVAAEGGATVISEPRRGYGSAVQAGIRCLAMSPPDVVVVLDADFSDDPTELERLLTPIRQAQADLVIGSRTLGQLEQGALLPQQRFGNWLATRLMAHYYGQHFTDLGPFRAIRFEELVALQLQDPDFGWNVEMQIRAIQKGLRIVEVPVSYRKRVGVSKISGTLRGTALAGHKILTTLYRLRRQGEPTRPLG
ncbi:MAG: glycosyltransferase family 2 protein [Myxococcota bacterium]